MAQKKSKDAKASRPKTRKQYKPLLEHYQENSQKWLILNHLIRHGSITNKLASDEMGIHYLPKRISEINEKEGQIIVLTKTVKGKNRYGRDTYYGIYRFVEG